MFQYVVICIVFVLDLCGQVVEMLWILIGVCQDQIVECMCDMIVVVVEWVKCDELQMGEFGLDQ